MTEEEEDDDEDIDTEFAVEAYIRSLPMDNLTEHERTLVAGNIRGFAAYLRPIVEKMLDEATTCAACGEPIGGICSWCA